MLNCALFAHFGLVYCTTYKLYVSMYHGIENKKSITNWALPGGLGLARQLSNCFTQIKG